MTIKHNEMMTLWQALGLCYDKEWDCPNDSVRYMKLIENESLCISGGT